jgi:hypothetical protein
VLVALTTYLRGCLQLHRIVTPGTLLLVATMTRHPPFGAVLGPAIEFRGPAHKRPSCGKSLRVLD